MELEQEIEQLRTQLAAQTAIAEHFRAFVEGTDDLVTQVDAEGRFTYVNAACERIYGLSPAQCIGQVAFDFVHPDDRESTQQAFAAWVQRREHSVTFENRVVHRDGRVFVLLWTVNLHYDDQGNLTQVNAICRDVGRLKQLQAESRQSQEFLQLVIDHLPQAVFWKDRESRFLGCNQRMLEDGRLQSHDQIIGKSDYDLPWGAYAADYQADDQAVMASNTPRLNAEEVLTQADGRKTWLRISKIPLRIDDEVIGVLGIYEDITEQKQQEGQLRKFKMLADYAPDGIAIAGLDTVIRYANASLENMLGRPLVGQSVTALVAPEEQPYLAAIVEQVLASGTATGQITYQRADQTTFVAQFSALTIPDTNGQPVAVASINRDISDLLRNEQERQALQEQIIEAQQAALRELSTPLLPIADEVVLIPIIGSIDSARAQQIMESLLEGIARHNASVAILDITGVKMVDTQVAAALIRAAQAAQLLGTQTIITGISPEIAQTLIQIGADLHSLLAKASLQQGVAYALAQRG